MRQTFAAICVISCVAAPAAVAAPAIDLGLGGVKLPQMDLPTVKPPAINGSHVTPPSVDLQPTVDSATSAVKGLTGGGSNGSSGSTSNPPSSTPGTNPSSPGTPSAPGAPGTPSAPAAPQTATQAQGSPKGDKPSAKGRPSGAGRASVSRDGSNAASAAGRNSAAKPKPETRDGGSSRGENASDTRPSTLVRIVQAFSWTLFGVLLAIAVLALGMTGRSATLARLTRKLKHQRGELTEDVGAMQMALLPALPKRIADTELSVAYRSAGPASGGDFHDVVELGAGRIGILVGDACGHGREALQTTALVHYTVRAYLEAGLQPREAIRLADDKVGSKLGGEFVTVLCAVYDPGGSALTYATAGHPGPIVIGAPTDHAITLLTDPPVGVGTPSGNRQTRISIPEGCEICFFSDGLSEARKADGGLIGRAGLVTELGEIGPGADAEELVERLDRLVRNDDDVTVLVVRPQSATGTTRVTEDLEIEEGLAGLGELRYFLDASGLDSHQAQRTQTEAIHRSRGRTAHLRIHRGGGGETNWEFAGASPAMGTSHSPVPRLELIMPADEPAAASPVA